MRVTNRAWIAGTSAAMVLIATGGYFLGVQPQLAHAAEADAGTASIDAGVGTTQVRIAALSKAAAKQDVLESQDSTLTKALPNALQANTFIRRVNTVAALDGVSIDSVSFGAGTAYAPPAGVAAAAAAATAASTAAATPAPSASASASTEAVTAAPAPILAATDPSVTSANLTVVPTTVVIVGPVADGLQFIKDIQRDERLFLVSAVTTQVNAEDAAKTTTTLTGSVYALKH